MKKQWEKILTEHQKKFLHYIINEHNSYGWHVRLPKLVLTGWYSNQQMVMLNDIGRVHKDLQNGDEVLEDVYGKLKKYK